MVQTSKEGQWAIFRTRAVLLVETANVGIGFIITMAHMVEDFSRQVNQRCGTYVWEEN